MIVGASEKDGVAVYPPTDWFSSAGYLLRLRGHRLCGTLPQAAPTSGWRCPSPMPMRSPVRSSGLLARSRWHCWRWWVAAACWLVEVLKSTRTGGDSVVDHALSMMVFVACLILFLVWPLAGTSLFFLIMLTTLVDVIAGFSVTIRSARRDYSVGGEN